MQLIASKATSAAQVRTPFGRLPREPKARAGEGERRQAGPHAADRRDADRGDTGCVPSRTATSASQTLSPSSNAITPTETKNRLALVPDPEEGRLAQRHAALALGNVLEPAALEAEDGVGLLDPGAQMTVPPFGESTWPTK